MRHWVWHHWSANANFCFQVAVAWQFPADCSVFESRGPTDRAGARYEPGLELLPDKADLSVGAIAMSAHPINVSCGPHPLQQLWFVSQSQLLAETHKRECMRYAHHNLSRMVEVCACVLECLCYIFLSKFVEEYEASRDTCTFLSIQYIIHITARVIVIGNPAVCWFHYQQWDVKYI